jgi:TRAP-type C4-dicarboxylate transport system permease small subunit
MAQPHFAPRMENQDAHVSGGVARFVLAALDSSLGWLVETLAAALVAAEIVLLFSGVVARYAFNHPLVWSDELASILFLWLAMFGAVVAFRRNEHMRMTAAVGALPMPARNVFDLFAVGAALAFLLLIIWPAVQYALEEVYITTPALGLPNIWRAAALPAGIALMALSALFRVATAGSRRVVAVALGVVAALVALFYIAAPVFQQLGNFNLLIFFVGVVAAAVFAGVPIAFAFGLAIFGYLALSTRTPLVVLVGRMDEGMSHLILLAVPLFVFLGLLIEMTGMARAMVAFLAN